MYTEQHIKTYNNIQYTNGIQKKVFRLIQICIPLRFYYSFVENSLLLYVYLQLGNNITDHMLAKEMIIILPHPSDPTSENGIKENRIVLDGEIYPLKQPQFSAR